MTNEGVYLLHNTRTEARPACKLKGWGFATDYQAAHQMGGDFYELFKLLGDPK